MATAAKRLPTGEVAADGAWAVRSRRAREAARPVLRAPPWERLTGTDVGGGAAGRSRGKPALAGQTSAPGALVAAKLMRQAGKSPSPRGSEHGPRLGHRDPTRG